MTERSFDCKRSEPLFLCLENPHIRNLKASRVEYSQGGIHDEKYQIVRKLPSRKVAAA